MAASRARQSSCGIRTHHSSSACSACNENRLIFGGANGESESFKIKPPINLDSSPSYVSSRLNRKNRGFIYRKAIVPFYSIIKRYVRVEMFAPSRLSLYISSDLSPPSRQGTIIEEIRQVVRERGFVCWNEGCGRGKWLMDGEVSIVFPKNYSIRVIVESSCWRQVIISHERIIMRTVR